MAGEAGLCAQPSRPAPAAEIVIACSGAEPVGFAVWFHSYSAFVSHRRLYLENLFVLREWRGGGICRALPSYLARVGLRGTAGTWKRFLLDRNDPAIGFYETNERMSDPPATGNDLSRLAAS